MMISLRSLLLASTNSLFVAEVVDLSLLMQEPGWRPITELSIAVTALVISNDHH